jgi:hypothetical protein
MPRRPPTARHAEALAAQGAADLSKKQLMDRAADLGIRDRSEMTKQDLGEAIARRPD